MLISACSIKEQRGGCPLYLNINFDKAITENDFYTSFVNVESAGPVYGDSVEIRQYESKGLDVKSPKGCINVSAAFAFEDFCFSGHSLVAKDGIEISPLFLWSDKVYSQDDLCHVEVLPRKQYCKMNIVVIGLNPGMNFEYEMRLRANCNALSIYGAKALEGDYTVIAERKNASGYEVLIPRQKENKLLLELLDGDDVLAVLDIGEYMENSAYNWNKPDLDDVIVVVDYTRLTASIEILDWNRNKVEVII